VNDFELTDHPRGQPRTTDTLLASLAARTRTLSVISGSEAIGSLLAGLGALGREVAGTAEGARLRELLLETRAVANGEAIFEALGIRRALESLPLTPIYEDIRNDFSLLASHDVASAIERLSEGAMVGSIGAVVPPEPVDFVDVLLGLWSYSRDIVAMVEAVAAGTGPEIVEPGDHTSLDGQVLR
jgi:hypothetical protein